MQINCGKKECDGKCPNLISKIATDVLENNELIVYPTETLYGIGGAVKQEVKEKIRDIKNSPPDKKISTAYKNLEQASEYFEIPELAWKIEEEFLPGPITIIIETDEGTEGIRIPDHPVATNIIEDFGPITSTSANLHDMADPIDVKSAKLQLRNKIKLYIDCGKCKYGVGSTVVKINNKMKILREGAISKETIGDRLGFEIY